MRADDHHTSDGPSVDVALPVDYPGKTAIFPAPVEHLVYAIFGVQSRATSRDPRLAAELQSCCAVSDGPGKVEHLLYRDEHGADCDVVLAFWTDRARHRRWRECVFDPWWRARPAAGPIGYWYEIIDTDKGYYQYGAGVPEQGGISALGELVPCDKFGYWGGYRDRVPASAHDDFAPAFTDMPVAVERATLGRRLRVETPDNLCFIREGQGWDKAGPEERHIWQDQMAPVVGRWVHTLRHQPADTGCLSLRFCRELDGNSGRPLEKQSQIAFLLSLAHIEHAARTTCTHLKVKQTFTDMYTAPRFSPQMHVWVEMLIAKRGTLTNEYVNCHPWTGLLPYFDVTDQA